MHAAPTEVIIAAMRRRRPEKWAMNLIRSSQARGVSAGACARNLQNGLGGCTRLFQVVNKNNPRMTANPSRNPMS